MATNDYNGWTNWETWRVNLWSDNDETLYRDKVEYSRRTEWTAESVKDWFLSWFPDGTPDMDNVGDYADVNWEELAESWNDV